MKTSFLVVITLVGFAVGGPARPALAGREFPIGTDATTVDLSTAPDAIPLDDGWAIPLKGARPTWYSPGLEQQVLAAGGTPVLAPNDAPLPSEVGIRPGGWMIAPYGCTMNFVFAKGSDFAIGTAGHCVDKIGQHVVLLAVSPTGSGPLVELSEPDDRRHRWSLRTVYGLRSSTTVTVS